MGIGTEPTAKNGFGRRKQRKIQCPSGSRELRMDSISDLAFGHSDVRWEGDERALEITG